MKKIIVVFFRGFLPDKSWKYVFIPFYLLGLPLLIFVVGIAHLSIIFNMGSKEDPLGYTILITK